ncbi:MAG TPA: response regulator [Acidobacteriota bacterium]|jgi:CheY-like chemotaxis protein
MTKSKGTVLLIDDDPATIHALNHLLVDSGFQVVMAKNGQDAILKAVKTKPDVIFMDMMMPGLDGFNATRQLRKISDFDRVPIIAFTAMTDRERILSVGCDDYIQKPLKNVPDLLKKMESWIQTRSQVDR